MLQQPTNSCEDVKSIADRGLSLRQVCRGAAMHMLDAGVSAEVIVLWSTVTRWAGNRKYAENSIRRRESGRSPGRLGVVSKPDSA